MQPDGMFGEVGLVVEDVEITVDGPAIVFPVPLVIESVEMAVDGPDRSFMAIESVECEMDGPAVSFLRLYIEITEIHMDPVDVVLPVGTYGNRLTSDGRNRRAVA
jgi:hypothetical protein